MNGYGALTDDGLVQQLSYLDTELGRLAMYRDMAESPLGQFLLEELKTRRERARNLYGQIDVTHESARFLLTTLQQSERECNEWIDRLVHSGNKAKSIEREMDQIRTLARSRKKAREDGPHFLPAQLRNKKEE